MLGYINMLLSYKVRINTKMPSEAFQLEGLFICKKDFKPGVR